MRSGGEEEEERRRFFSHQLLMILSGVDDADCTWYETELWPGFELY
jgi:hypothetical protein